MKRVSAEASSGKHLILGGLDPEQILQLLELVGIGGRDVVVLRPVLGEIEELPLDAVHDVLRLRRGAVPRLPVGHRRGHPAVVIERPIAEHLEILGLVRRGRIGVGLVEGVGQAHALDRRLGDAVDLLRRADAGHFEDGRNDIDDVVELVADAAGVGDVTRPGDGHAVADAAEVGRDLLGPLVGRAHRPGPADRHVGIGDCEPHAS